MKNIKKRLLIDMLSILIIAQFLYICIKVKELNLLKEMGILDGRLISIMIIKGLLVISILVSLIILSIYHLNKETNFDYMTKTFSRSKLFSDLNGLISKKKDFTLCYIDIDNFKQINDTYGHSAGDKLLNEFSTRIMKINKNVLSCYRIGGDEFIILITDPKERHKMLEAIKAVKDNKVELKDGRRIVFNFCIGVVDNDFVSNADKLLEQADCNMYRKKCRDN